nr:hypothetical protein [Tanacetum cinerariifolium]
MDVNHVQHFKIPTFVVLYHERLASWIYEWVTFILDYHPNANSQSSSELEMGTNCRVDLCPTREDLPEMLLPSLLSLKIWQCPDEAPIGQAFPICPDEAPIGTIEMFTKLSG